MADGSDLGTSRPRTFVHIGAMKTGTSFLQHRLWSSRTALAEQVGVQGPFAQLGQERARALEDRFSHDYRSGSANAVTRVGSSLTPCTSTGKPVFSSSSASSGVRLP